MFKDKKQFIGLEKCHTLDYDAHIAHTSQRMMMYTIFSHLKFQDEYQTFGDIFRDKNKNRLFTIADQIRN